MSLLSVLQHRVLLLDGALGTMLSSFAACDTFNLSQPATVAQLHRRYLEAGADILTTNTFLSRPNLQRGIRPTDAIALNRAGVRIARAEAERMTHLTPDRPRFVVGSIGSEGGSTLMGESAYVEQMRVLAEEGVDALLVETIVDTDAARAALQAYDRVKAQYSIPLMLSFALVGKADSLLSGETIEEMVHLVAAVQPLSVGLNCGRATDYTTCLQRIAQCASCFVSCHPNAGLPNEQGAYPDTPQTMAQSIRYWIENRWVNIVGGCCGTTPAYTAAMRVLLDSLSQTVPPRAVAQSFLRPSYGNP